MEPASLEDDKFRVARQRLEQLQDKENSQEPQLEAFARARRALIKKLGIESFLEYGSEPER